MLEFVSRFEIKDENDTFILIFDNSSYVILGDRYTNEYSPMSGMKTVQLDDLVNAVEHDMKLLSAIANDENSVKRLLALQKLFSPSNKHQLYKIYGYLADPLSTSLQQAFNNKDNVFNFPIKPEVVE